MKKDNKKRNKKIALICLGIFLILSGFASMDTKEGFGFIVFCLLFIAAGAFLLFLAFKKPKNKEENQQTNILVTPNKQTPAPTTNFVPKDITENKTTAISFPRIDGFYLEYSYTKDFCIIDEGDNISRTLKKLSDNIGKELTVVQEPENEFDHRAVALHIDNERIGYIYRGKTQDMANDWIRCDRPIKAYVNEVILSECKATYKIGFYKSLDGSDGYTISFKPKI